ncbi:MAG TPA: DUF962 domain-containing protein [Rubrivivax sp.]|nr:DUF962 domain-containing protein [Burkholderiales bacterium]HNU12330.1 DUF962 domain-containing protein [Rubrivivax sp.]
MTAPLRPAVDLLVQYARFHRDRRNILMHFVGVPMIVLALAVLLSRPGFAIAGLPLSPAWVALLPLASWYLARGGLRLGLAVNAGIGLLVALAHGLPAGGIGSWLAWGLGLLALGWSIQFVGHYYEGRKPAFLDDLGTLPVGPMFVTLEMLAPLGLFKSLAAEVERRAGPTVLRNLAHPA